MKHIILFENFEMPGIKTCLANKNEENFLFIKHHFKDIPITCEQFIQRDHIFVYESRIGKKLVGVVLCVIRYEKALSKDIAIPVEYNLPRIHMNYIRILEEYRKSGIGKSLVDSIKDYAIKNNVGIITANVKLDNIASQNLCVSCGFIKSPVLNGNGANTFYISL